MQSIRNLSLKRRLVPTLDEGANYFGGNVVGIILDAKTKTSYNYLLALLGSNLLNEFFTQRFVTISLTSTFLGELPIRRINFTTPASQRAALVAEAKALYEGGLAGQGGAEVWRGWRERWAGLWAWADARLPRGAGGAPDTEGEQSDTVHDLLAFLAERMIELHRRKQAGAAAFTGWLEEQTGSQVGEWALKTVVQSFWEQPWDEIERALQKNRGRFMQAQGLRGKAAEVALLPLLRAARGRWGEAAAALAPTLAAITATDRLIDLLVYRLYGLTDEEIDLVEG